LQKGNLKFSPKLAYYLTRFCTLNQGLPQGSPASPIISNLICWNLDNRLRGLADDYDVAYSRYADDLTFSAQHPLPDAFLAKLDEIINSEHFTINAKKVRLQKANVSQEVTGLVVNEKVNLKRDFIKGIRALLHNWETLGYEEAQNKFIGTYIPKKGKGKAQLSNVVSGKLLYFKMVRGEEDLEYQKYKQHLERLLSGNFKTKAKEVADIQFPIHHDPRKVVGFLRQFRTVNDSGFRELLHDPDKKEFDFIANMEKINLAMPEVEKFLTPKLFRKLKTFVEVYNRDGIEYFNTTKCIPLVGGRWLKPQNESQENSLKEPSDAYNVKAGKRENYEKIYQTISFSELFAQLKTESKVLETELILPSFKVAKAANEFRYQIRVGTDFFHDLVLVNALKPTVNQLNAYDQITIKYEPSEDEFGVNCSFFTDSWEVRNAIQILLKDFALNPAYVSATEKRTIVLRSVTVQPDLKKTLFCSNIYIQLIEGKSNFEQMKRNADSNKALNRLTGLADWSILIGEDSKMGQHFLLSSPDAINHKVPYFEGITHKLTFFQS
jgi:hypothetical protein